MPSGSENDDVSFGLVADWVTKRTGVPAADLRPSTRIDAVMEDSLDLVELVMMIEDDLRLDLPDCEGEDRMVTLGDLAGRVRRAREK
ncbi:MAG: acyl carrier protein [Fimbriimonas sp.]